MVVQYHPILDNEASIINDIGRCASCHQPGDAATRNDAVRMRMMMEVLAPCMQDGGDADVGTEVLAIGGWRVPPLYPLLARARAAPRRQPTDPPAPPVRRCD